MKVLKKIATKEALRPNTNWQKILGGVFLPILIASYFFHWLGFFILICMILGLGVAFWNGRKWCDFACPRGSFFDAYLMKISPQKPLPMWFYDYKFRLIFIALLFSFLSFNLYRAWPDVNALGFAFVKTLTITTIISIFLSLFFRARAWCVLCPVGTFSGLIGGRKKQLKVDFGKCVNCTNCVRVCPMGLTPYKDKTSGKLQSRDCIKCGSCVTNCPVGALKF